MKVTSSLRTIGRSGARALVLAAVGALGLGIGRWVVPAAEEASTALRVGEMPVSSTAPGVDAGAGHVIGIAFGQTLRTAPVVDGGPAWTAPDSSGEGHVVGIRFRQASATAGEAAAADSPAEGHVIGIQFR